MFASAAATAVAAFHEVDKIVERASARPELKLGASTLATADPGKPQTLMLLGSDKRAEERREAPAAAAALGHDHAGAARPVEEGHRDACRCRAT